MLSDAVIGSFVWIVPETVCFDSLVTVMNTVDSGSCRPILKKPTTIIGTLCYVRAVLMFLNLCVYLFGWKMLLAYRSVWRLDYQCAILDY